MKKRSHKNTTRLTTVERVRGVFEALTWDTESQTAIYARDLFEAAMRAAVRQALARRKARAS